MILAPRFDLLQRRMLGGTEVGHILALYHYQHEEILKALQQGTIVLTFLTRTHARLGDCILCRGVKCTLRFQNVYLSLGLNALNPAPPRAVSQSALHLTSCWGPSLISHLKPNPAWPLTLTSVNPFSQSPLVSLLFLLLFSPPVSSVLHVVWMSFTPTGSWSGPCPILVNSILSGFGIFITVVWSLDHFIHK